MRSGIFWYIVAAFLLLVLTLAALAYAIAQQAMRPEIILGLTVIVGVTVLILVLFIMAAGFTALKMNDPGQALGLPKGSIRALIALLLIVIWIIVSVYLFTVVGNTAQVNSPIAQLAQQVETAIGTLVVAVAAFYFGSRSVEAATRALTDGQRLLPAMQLSDNNLAFTTTVGNNPDVQTLALTNTGGGTLNWTVGTPSAAWLRVTPINGSNTANASSTLTFNVNVVGMVAGSYTATVVITPSVGTAVTVTVSLTVT